MEAALPGFPPTVCSDLWGIPPTRHTHSLSPFLCQGSCSPSASLWPSLDPPGKCPRLSLLSEKKKKKKELQNNMIPFMFKKKKKTDTRCV